MSSEGFTAFTKGIAHCTGLQILKLGDCIIGASSAISLCDAMKTLSLQELDISGNCIGSEGKIALSKYLTSIQRLDISLNAIGTKGVLY